MPLVKLAETQQPAEEAKPTSALVVFQGYIGEQSVDELLADLNDSISRGVEEIQVSFTTPGGEIPAGLRLYDELRKIAGQVELSTHAFEVVASMGVAIYLAGDKRTIGPQARLILHSASSRFDVGQQLTAAQLRHLAEQMDGEDGREREIIVDRTGLSEDEAKALVDGTLDGHDTVLPATDAVAKGFATAVEGLTLSAGIWYSQLGPYAAPE
jgi:ATP-dependent protease ClpP protease subunit